MKTTPNPSSSTMQRLIRALEQAHTQLAAAKARRYEPLAIIGMACRFPGAETPEEFWTLLRDGVDMVTDMPATRWNADTYYNPTRPMPSKMYTREGAFIANVDQFDPLFFGISPREAVGIDPQQRLLLEASWEALERAGLAPEQLVNSQTGVFIGIGGEEYGALNNVQGLSRGTRDLAAINIHAVTNSGNSVAAGRIAYNLGLQGPTLAVDTACSSSLVAVHLACQSLRTGECDLALAGGVSLMISPISFVELSQMQALSPDGRCKTFDATANGYGRGEGCGIILLKRLSDAVADGDEILAVIKGSAINHDGPSSGLTVPNKHAQEKVLRQALSNARLDPAEVSYIEAHGTGTSLGDPIELRALAKVFQKRTTPLLIGSVKTNFGHLEAAAGIAGLMKVVLSLQYGEIPAHLHLQNPTPHFNWQEMPIQVPTVRTSWPTDSRIAGVSSFGISGTNSHVILAAPPAAAFSDSSTQSTGSERVEPDRQLLTLSAKSHNALQDLAQRYDAYLNTHPETALADLCFTANTGRKHFKYRLAVVADSTAQLHQQLTAFTQSQSTTPTLRTGVANTTPQRMAFLFTGQGAQYVGMGRHLYETQPVFRQVLERCNTLLQPYLDVSLLDLLYPKNQEPSLLDQTAYTQPALFALEYALAELWKSWGIEPDVVMGHSVGEYVAACVAGVLSLDDGLKLMAERGRFMQSLPQGGQMVSVKANVETMAAYLKPYQESVSIAAVNGPQATVISGRQEVINAICGQLTSAGIKSKKLAVSHAFHSPLMKPILASFSRTANQVDFTTPHIPLISNVTGSAVTHEVTTPTYWCEHIMAPVLFAKGVASLHSQSIAHCIEIGPKPVLLGMLHDCLSENTEMTLLPTIRPDQEWEQLLKSLGGLYVQGVPIAWQGVYQGVRRQRLRLPTYPFQHQRYWIEPTKSKRGSETLRPLIDKMIKVPLHQEMLFEREFSVESLPFLADHQIYDRVVVPGACHLAFVLSAAELWQGQLDFAIQEVFFPQPLIIPDTGTRTVQLVLTPAEPQNGATTKYEFKLISFDSTMIDAETASKPATHAVGYLHLSTHRTPDKVVVDELRQRCNKPIVPDTLYINAAQQQILFGPAFRWVAEFWQGETETLARFALPEAIDTLNGYQLHPALLDACFQCIGETSTQTSSEPHLPFGVETLHIYRQVSGEAWWCHASRRMTASQEERWDILLFDNQGNILVDIEGFHTRAAPSAKFDIQPWREWLYTPTWQKHSSCNLLADLKSSVQARQWLIFADETGVGEAVAAQLRSYGEAPILIYANHEYQQVDAQTFRIAPHIAADYQQLLAQFPALHGVVHLWSLDCPTLTAGSEWEAGIRHACETALHCVQTLAQDRLMPPRLCFVTRDAQAVLPQDVISGVAQATLWGIGRTIALEHPEFQPICIDLDGATPPMAQIEALCTELLNESGAESQEEQVALRNGTRYVARLGRYSEVEDAAANPSFAIRADATYLITGGLGGLGLKVSQELISQGAQHLLLMGRRPPSQTTNQQLDILRQLGAEVKVVLADVTDLDQVASVLHQVPAAYPLRGIVHAAGVLDDGVLLQQNWARFEKVLVPKVRGTYHLHTLTQSMELDFFVLFSSNSGLLGNPGQANYAAANVFLDAFAYQRQAQGLPALTIDWNEWSEVGMAAHLNLEQMHGFEPISPTRGVQVFTYLLSQNPPQVSVMPVDWPQFLASEEQISPFLAEFAKLALPSVGEVVETQMDIQRRLAESVDSDVRYAHVLDYFSARLAAMLGFSSPTQIDLQEGLIELGLDSLMAVELRGILRRELRVNLPIATLFGGASIKEIARPILTRWEANQTDPQSPALTTSSTMSSTSEALEVIEVEI